MRDAVRRLEAKMAWREDKPGGRFFSVSLSAEDSFTLGLDRHREDRFEGRFFSSCMVISQSLM
jgi:hypothetical protein